jgi:hypothetical protein
VTVLPDILICDLPSQQSLRSLCRRHQPFLRRRPIRRHTKQSPIKSPVPGVPAPTIELNRLAYLQACPNTELVRPRYLLVRSAFGHAPAKRVSDRLDLRVVSRRICDIAAIDGDLIPKLTRDS